MVKYPMIFTHGYAGAFRFSVKAWTNVVSVSSDEVYATAERARRAGVRWVKRWINETGKQ